MFKKKVTLGIVIVFCISLMAFNFNANGLTIVTILSPQNITDISNRFYVEGQTTPTDTAYMVVRWQDNIPHTGNAISISPTYDPYSLTGYTPPSPRSSWQKGEFDDSYSGSPVFQLNGTSGGILMNSWFTTYQQITGGGQNTVYEYQFSNPSCPWSTSSSVLWLQGDLKLPWFANWDNDSDGNAPVGQLSYGLYMRDTSTNQVIAMVINAFDNRSTTPPEYVASDTYTYFASTHFGATRYSTPNQYSGSWRSTTWSTYTFYRSEITRQNVINIASDLNTQYGTSFSTDPSDYVLTSVCIIQETFREDGDQISMGCSFRDFSAFEVY